MFRTLIILMLACSFCWGAGITAQQTDQVQQAANKIAQTAQQIQQFAAKVRQLIDNNYQFNVDFSTTPVQLTPQQQQDIVTYYQGLKNQLAAQFGNLP